MSFSEDVGNVVNQMMIEDPSLDVSLAVAGTVVAYIDALIKMKRLPEFEELESELEEMTEIKVDKKDLN